VELSLVGAALPAHFFNNIYNLISYLGDWLRRNKQRLRWAKPPEGRFYYEADLRLELRLSSESSGNLLSGQVNVEEPTAGGDHHDRVIWNHIERLIKPRHSSYRIERNSKDFSIHKVHLERTVVWSGHAPPTPKLRFFRLPRARARKDEMLAHFIYEIVFNRLTSPHGFVLRDFRALAIHDRSLGPQELDAFRRLIGKHFINRHLAENEDGLDLDSDALVFMPGTRREVRSPARLSARRTQA
jgi:hypothetical protein